jgi:hypothetical protein
MSGKLKMFGKHIVGDEERRVEELLNAPLVYSQHNMLTSSPKP